MIRSFQSVVRTPLRFNTHKDTLQEWIELFYPAQMPTYNTPIRIIWMIVEHVIDRKHRSVISETGWGRDTTGVCLTYPPNSENTTHTHSQPADTVRGAITEHFGTWSSAKHTHESPEKPHTNPHKLCHNQYLYAMLRPLRTFQSGLTIMLFGFFFQDSGGRTARPQSAAEHVALRGAVQVPDLAAHGRLRAGDHRRPAR